MQIRLEIEARRRSQSLRCGEIPQRRAPVEYAYLATGGLRDGLELTCGPPARQPAAVILAIRFSSGISGRPDEHDSVTWEPMRESDPALGAIEHKYYCEDLGLVVVKENSGGKTVFEKLISVASIP